MTHSLMKVKVDSIYYKCCMTDIYTLFIILDGKGLN